MIEAWFRLVLRNRGRVMLVLALITALAGLSTSRGVLSSSLQQLFFGESVEYAAWLERARSFGGAESVVVGYADPDPFSVASLERLERATAVIATLHDIKTTRSLLDAPRVSDQDGMLVVDTWADVARAHPDESQALALKAAADPNLSGLLIDETGQQAAAFVAEMTVDPMRRGEDVPILLDDIHAAMLDAGFAEVDVHYTGLPVVVGGLIDQSLTNIIVLFPITCIVLLTSVYALFGRFAPALVALGVSLVAVLWTMGFQAILDPRFSIFAAIIPAVVVIVGFSDIIHLWSAWLTELADGKSREDAIVASAADVGRACMLTSVTTFVGFVSLSFVPTPAFRLLGVVLGFGVGIALLLAMTAVPVVLSYLPVPETTARTRRLEKLVDWIIGGASALSTRHPVGVLAGFAAFAVAAGVGLSQLNIDANFVNRFAKNSRVRQDADWFGVHFAGTDTFDLFIEVPDAEGIISDETWRGVTATRDAVSALEGVDHVLSVVDVLDEVHTALGGEGRPEGQALVAQELLLFEAAGGSDLDRLLDFERKVTRMSVRIEQTGVRTMNDVATAAADAATTNLPPGTEVLSASLVTLLGGWLDEILAGQRRGMLVSCSVIALLMAGGLRSARVGFLSMIPNLLPLGALMGFCALAWDPVDSDTLIIAMMAIGIGVDDTVHFLVRYRLERSRTTDTATAISRTFTFAGRAIVTTTIILGLGFLPLAASTYMPLRLIGGLLPCVLVIALIADLLLVPAMIQVGWLRFKDV